MKLVLLTLLIALKINKISKLICLLPLSKKIWVNHWALYRISINENHCFIILSLSNSTITHYHLLIVREQRNYMQGAVLSSKR
jgi:hypothetical protein